MKKHAKGPWYNANTLFIPVIVVFALLVSITLTSNYQISSDGMFISKNSCYDTDGINFTKKGSMTIFHGKDPYFSYSDECKQTEANGFNQSGKLIEYYCDDNAREKYNIIEKECNCQDARCVG